MNGFIHYRLLFINIARSNFGGTVVIGNGGGVVGGGRGCVAFIF